MSETQTSEDFVRRMLLKDHTVDWVVNASGWTRRAVEELHAELERDQLLPGQAKSPIQPPVKTMDPPRPMATQPEPAQPLRVVPDPSPAAAPLQDLQDLKIAAQTVVQPTAESKAKSNTATELLVRADKVADKRVKAALGRARKALIDLAAEMNRHDDQAAARAEVAELEAKLAAAKARLRGEPVSGSQSTDHEPCTVQETELPPKVDGRKNNSPPLVTVDYPVAEVRAWAKAEGLPCRGRFLRREVVDAWRAAMDAER